MSQFRVDEARSERIERDLESNRNIYSNIAIGDSRDGKSISACAPNADDEICLNNEVLHVYNPLSGKKKDNRLFPEYPLY